MYIHPFPLQNGRTVLINMDKINLVSQYGSGSKIFLDCGKDVAVRMQVTDVEKLISDLKLNSR